MGFEFTVWPKKKDKLCSTAVQGWFIVLVNFRHQTAQVMDSNVQKIDLLRKPLERC